MTVLDNIDDVAFFSELEVDKILETYTGSFSVGSSSLATLVIPHSWGEHVLPVMLFSVDNTVWQDAGSSVYATSTLSSEVSANCSTDANNITVVVSNNDIVSKTCYYKICLIVED